MPGPTQEGDLAPRDKSMLCATRFGVVLLIIVLLLLSTVLIVLIILLTNEEVRSSQHNNRMPTPTPTPNGAIFTRWGRSVCPEDATLLYEGVMAAGHKDYTGGPADYFCLPKSPQYASTTTGTDSSEVYMVKFSGTADEVFSKANAPGISNIDFHPAVCAVCQSSRVVQLMIPARNTCLPGWSREYFGYLMSSQQNIDKAQRSTVCVDHAPDVSYQTGLSHNFLLPLELRCDRSLPCNNYIDKAELTCVLCTR